MTAEAASALTPAAPDGDIQGLLTVEATVARHLQGWCHEGSPGVAYGGNVLAQALLAAGSDLPEGHVARSFHAHFVSPGPVTAPISYLVEHSSDGGAESLRSVWAGRDEACVLSMTAMFGYAEPAPTRHVSMPDVPAPEELTDLRDRRAAPMPLASAPVTAVLDIRFCGDPFTGIAPRADTSARQDVWIRTRQPVGGGRAERAAALAYLSDVNLARASHYPHHHGVEEVRLASLDHAVWFHRDHDPNEWLLFTQQSPNAVSGRGLARGHLFSRSARLVASVAQETLLRQQR